IGEASFFSKLVYFKNLLLLPLFYFFGRQIKLEITHWRKAYKVLFGLILCTAIVAVMEKFMGVHLHTLIDWSRYQLEVYDNEVGGVFGIGFTFEAQGGKPRYGAFFAHPLELSASMLLPVALSVYLLLNVRFRENKVKYLIFLGGSLLCVLLAYSRATFVAFFIMLIYMAFLLRYYKILFSAFIGAVAFTIYVFYFASEDLRYFVIDTITFQNSSSITHLIDWAEAIESMISNPLGIGLATSGNINGMEEELTVGGENQFLIFGVQMGVIGMLLYMFIYYLAIRDSVKAYRMAESKETSVIPFVAASVKVGLLLPLFTANVEAYLFIALVSWWLVGYSETQYRKVILEKRKNQIKMKTSFA
ncbi:MAG TPA: O-antigen ligase family protein, partial [Roseivirga sp.]